MVLRSKGARRRPWFKVLGFVLLVALPVTFLTSAARADDPTVPRAGGFWFNRELGIDSLWSEMEPARDTGYGIAALPPDGRQGPSASCETDRNDVLTPWRFFPDSERAFHDPNPANPLAGVYNAGRVCYTKLPGRVKLKWSEYGQFQYGCNADAAALIAALTSSGWAEPKMWTRITANGVASMSMDVAKRVIVRSLKTNPGAGCFMTDQWVNSRGTGYFGPVLFTQWNTTIGTMSLHWTHDLVNTIPASFDNVNGYWWAIRRVQARDDQPVAASTFVAMSAYDQSAKSDNGTVSGNFDCCYSLNGLDNPYHDNVLYVPISSDIPATAPYNPPPPPTVTPQPPAQPQPVAPPPVDNPPSGTLRGVAFTRNGYQLHVTGNASDPQAGSVKVDFFGPGSGQWLGSAWTSGGAFDAYVTPPSWPPDFRVCAAVENVGSQWWALNRWIGCIDPDHPPTGSLTFSSYTGSFLDVNYRGYASDVDTGAPIQVDLVTDDGQIRASTTTDPATTGFDVTAALPFELMGFRLCAWARDWGGTKDTQIGCLIPQSKPIGSLDSVTSAGLNAFNVNGWAYQPKVAGSALVKVTVDGAASYHQANAPRGDVEVATPGLGVNRGFAPAVYVPPGVHTVCALILNQLGADGSDTFLGCKSVDNTIPVGTVDSVKRTSPTTYRVGGWAVDPQWDGPIGVDVWIDPGKPGAIRFPARTPANGARPDLAALWQGANAHYTGNHGYVVDVTGVPLGQHDICAYAIGVGTTGALTGDNPPLGCKTVGTPEQSSPVGRLDAVTGPSLVNGSPVTTVSGWALDPDLGETNNVPASGAIDVHVYWDPAGFSPVHWEFPGAANQRRPDLATDWAGWGLDHGFQVQVPVPTQPGDHQLCAYGINKFSGSNKALGCKTVTSSGHNPFGGQDTVSTLRWNGTKPVYTVSGWSVDPDSAAPTTIDAYWDPGTAQATGVSTGTSASAARADIGSAYPGYGSGHGFSIDVAPPATPGTHQLCTYGINLAGSLGGNGVLGCTTVVTPGHDPTGGLDRAELGYDGSRGIHVAGWMLDPDTADPGTVHVYVDGVQKLVIPAANVARGDIGASFPGFGANHGFDAVIGGIGVGSHTVCAYGINTGAGTTNTTLGCRTVTLADDALGSVDTFTTSAGSVRVAGWALDPNVVVATQVHVYIDGVGSVLTANTARADIATSYPGFGPQHGFDNTFTGLSAGTHTVDVWSINAAGTPGGNTLLTHRTIAV